MKHTSLLLMTMATGVSAVDAQPTPVDVQRLHAMELQLADVMELTDIAVVKTMLTQVEKDFVRDPSELNKVRSGIIYHEVALNLSFLSKTEYQGFAQKSYDLLTALEGSSLAPEWMPFVASYRASALSLVGAETRKLSLVGEAFTLFQRAVDRYADISCLPEFLRGSVAENLPWIFYGKKKFARIDFASIIGKQERDAAFANPKIMSFTYWAWANAHQGKRFRKQALIYLAKAIELDPKGAAARDKSKELLAKWG